MNPALAPFITANFAVAIKGLFLLLCAVAALISARAPVCSLSIAALCGINGLTHVLGAIRARQYAPGLLTGVLLYLPLAVVAYRLLPTSIVSGFIQRQQELSDSGRSYQPIERERAP